MSSTNKTTLGFNSWEGSDIPSREDFNSDNYLCNSLIANHTGNNNIHITANERIAWNKPYHMSTYFGNGEVSRTVNTSCPFTPKWGIVFALSTFPTVTDFNNQADYNYFGLVSTHGSNTGLSLNGSNLVVTQSSVGLMGDEYRSYNENGVTYVFILFR